MNDDGKSECEKLYYISEIDTLIKKQKVDFKHTLSDAILFLLYADRHNTIKGKTKQMKEVFLVLREVLNNQSVQPTNFKKNRFGPYGEEVVYTIDQLIFLDLVSVSGKKTTNAFAIGITSKGIEYIKDRFKELPYKVQLTLKQKRTDWDNNKDIRNLGCSRYDEFLKELV